MVNKNNNSSNSLVFGRRQKWKISFNLIHGLWREGPMDKVAHGRLAHWHIAPEQLVLTIRLLVKWFLPQKSKVTSNRCAVVAMSQIIIIELDQKVQGSRPCPRAQYCKLPVLGKTLPNWCHSRILLHFGKNLEKNIKISKFLIFFLFKEGTFLQRVGWN